ncbi:hypothetical protein NDN08_000391 [Rhodosorus marinus]|uniref:Sugar phosphate transporter domain-containing protein n=1 Tax=Rhodosorus marinus TaxID=101924 RepID=A0AAV8UMX5_9RHOD|nr:hypothetical protein NDN08_000391 [Rhodosorus marinus]
MKIVHIALFIVLWYFLSSSIIFATKWELTDKFPFPLFVTFNSNLVTSLLAIVITRFPGRRQRPLSKESFYKFVLPIGACVAVEIGCSNVALKLLEVSFSTVLKGSAPIFVMFWAVILGAEVFSWRLMASLLMIAIGIGLATAGEGEFKVLGLVLMIVSVAMSGFRWALTHTLLQGAEEGRMTPLNAMLYTSPITGLFVLPFALGFEIKGIVGLLAELSSAEKWRIFAVLLAIGVFVAFLLLTEYTLVRATSSLTVSVAGIFKELVTIVGGIIIFHDNFDLLNIIGFVVCQIGILDYIILRYKASLGADVHAGEEYDHVGSENGNTVNGYALEVPLDGEGETLTTKG